MFRYDQGVVLIELLMSIVVISFIVFLLLNLMILTNTFMGEDRLFSKQLQLSTVIYQDILKATEIMVDDSCLTIEQNQDRVTYCQVNQDFVRKVNNKGFERVVSDSKVEVIDNQIIWLKVDDKFKIPIWSKN